MEEEKGPEGCPLFGVESGAPVIGLGILMILFGAIPPAIGSMPFSLPVALVFIGFGIFLIWTGLTR
jgi:hypothetical protein